MKNNLLNSPLTTLLLLLALVPCALWAAATVRRAKAELYEPPKAQADQPLFRRNLPASGWKGEL